MHITKSTLWTSDLEMGPSDLQKKIEIKENIKDFGTLECNVRIKIKTDLGFSLKVFSTF